MVEDAERKVVLHEVFAAVPQVEGIPVLELLLHGVQEVFVDAGVLRDVVAVAGARKYVVEDFLEDKNYL
jgi:hypothetical protein